MIPVPLIAILAALAWVDSRQGDAVRWAVDKAVTELVAGARIAALEAEIDGCWRLAMYAAANAEEARRRAETAEAAGIGTGGRNWRSPNSNAGNSRMSLPNARMSPPYGCRVDQRLLDRLRNR